MSYGAMAFVFFTMTQSKKCIFHHNSVDIHVYNKTLPLACAMYSDISCSVSFFFICWS